MAEIDDRVLIQASGEGVIVNKTHSTGNGITITVKLDKGGTIEVPEDQSFLAPAGKAKKHPEEDKAVRGAETK